MAKAGAARIHIEGVDELLEDAVCLLGHIEMDPNADPEDDTAQRTARMAVEKIREAQEALSEAKAMATAAEPIDPSTSEDSTHGTRAKGAAW